VGSSYKGLKANIANTLFAIIFTIQELNFRENLKLRFMHFITTVFEHE